MSEKYISSMGNEVDEYGRVIPIGSYNVQSTRDAKTGSEVIGAYLTGAGHEVPVAVDDSHNIVQLDDRYTVENDDGKSVLFEAGPHMRALKQEAAIVDAQTRNEQYDVSQAGQTVDTLRQRDTTEEELRRAEDALGLAEKRLNERTGSVAELFYELRKDAPDYFDNLPTAEYIKIARDYSELLKNRDSAVFAIEQPQVSSALRNIGAIEYYINDSDTNDGYNDGRYTQQSLHDLIYMRAVHENKVKNSRNVVNTLYGVRIDMGYDYKHAERYALGHMGEQPEEVKALKNISKRTMSGIQVAEMYLAAFNALKKLWSDDIEAADNALVEFKKRVAEQARGSESQGE